MKVVPTWKKFEKRCPKATNGIGSDVDIFNGRSVSDSDWPVPDYNIVLGHYIRFKEF